VEADVIVPEVGRPALLTFSRPYFRGYEARLGDEKLPVASYHGLFPTVDIPAGSHGRLALIYQPGWLIWGTASACASVLVILTAIALRRMESRRAVLPRRGHDDPVGGADI
jgi:uncharacterized membrane protein YfhO